MFTGDFIFNSSIGRTDLGGNDKDMTNSLKDFEKYDDDITIYPGHGPKTTLGQEKNYFPFYYK
jgi:glyoxylase-like metal-dependent hydrolase (beta-lactamase superfamily II)